MIILLLECVSIGRREQGWPGGVFGDYRNNCLVLFGQQEGDERLEVTVGGNTILEYHYHNRPLKKGAAYWIVVVTEKWSGKLLLYGSSPTHSLKASLKLDMSIKR